MKEIFQLFKLISVHFWLDAKTNQKDQDSF